MSPERILIVGSGHWQIPLIRKAKARGLFVVNTNLHADSEGFADADLGVALDIYDKDGHLRLARAHGVRAAVTGARSPRTARSSAPRCAPSGESNRF